MRTGDSLDGPGPRPCSSHGPASSRWLAQQGEGPAGREPSGSPRSQPRLLLFPQDDWLWLEIRGLSTAHKHHEGDFSQVEPPLTPAFPHENTEFQIVRNTALAPSSGTKLPPCPRHTVAGLGTDTSQTPQSSGLSSQRCFGEILPGGRDSFSFCFLLASTVC